MTNMPERSLILFLIANGFAVCSAGIYLAMHHQVNRKLPEGQRISHLIGHYWKFRKVWRLHREYYPRSRLSVALTVSLAAGMFFLLAAAWRLGFL